ncbi:MAG: GAF domain-containing protein, partial [Pseudomonadota bacterium]
MTSPDLLPVLTAVSRSLAAPGQPGAGFEALDRAFAETLGHKLFTILLFHADSGDCERFYTNQPDAYPVGGRKALNPTFWTEQVLRGQQPYIGRS